jgi:hypothetical protein
MTGDFAPDQVAVSGDGDRIAALLPTTPDSDPKPQAKLVVWDVTTGRTVGELPALSSGQSAGNVALDLHGDRVAVTDLSGTVSFWQLDDPTAHPMTMYASGWTDMLPVGSGADTPLVLVDADIIGLVLPSAGKPAPMRKLAARPLDTTAGVEHPDQWCAEMIAMLASGVPSPDEVTDLPTGAYTGTLGG